VQVGRQQPVPVGIGHLDERLDQQACSVVDPDVQPAPRGDDVFFSATGVTDGDVLQGVRYRGAGATTESLVMRSRSGTVRRVHATHDRSKLRAMGGVRFG
jgi:hypothetical protein